MPPLIEKICQVCGKEFRVYPYRAIVAKFCSYVCSGKSLKTKMERQCLNCGFSFLISPSRFRYYKGAGKYCSRSCRYQGIVKETAGKPIKGKYGQGKRKADIDWQKAVRDKDAFTCQRCGVIENYIHAHHIAPRSRRPDLRHDVPNGKCLCSSCHSWVHHHPREATATGLLSDVSFEWARKEDYWRRTGNILITYKGETKCASGWAKVTGFSADVIRYRWHLGWSPAEILTKPLRSRYA